MAKVSLTFLLKCFNTLIASDFVKISCGDEFIQHLIKAKSNLIDTL